MAQKENTPEHVIPSLVNDQVRNAPTTPRPIKLVHVASPIHEENPSQPNVS